MIELKQIADELKSYSQVKSCVISQQGSQYYLYVERIGKPNIKEYHSDMTNLINRCRKIKSELQDEELDYYDY